MKNIKWIVNIIIPIIFAIVSITVLSPWASSVDTHQTTIQSLDDKQKTVLELSAASIATSTAISMLPGDTATPIADQLAQYSNYFLIIVAAIFLEKYLVTITGYISFTYLIPICCGLWLLNVIMKKEYLKEMSLKVLVFALAIFLIMPITTKCTTLIEQTYEASIQETLDMANETTNDIENSTEEEKTNIFNFFSGIKTQVADSIKNIENMLNNFLESIAVMIVTCCIIPILVPIFLLWLIKIVFEKDLIAPTVSKLGHKQLLKLTTNKESDEL